MVSTFGGISEVAATFPRGARGATWGIFEIWGAPALCRAGCIFVSRVSKIQWATAQFGLPPGGAQIANGRAQGPKIGALLLLYHHLDGTGSLACTRTATRMSKSRFWIAIHTQVPAYEPYGRGHVMITVPISGHGQRADAGRALMPVAVFRDSSPSEGTLLHKPSLAARARM